MILKRILLSLGLVALLCTAAVAQTPSFSANKSSVSFSYGVTPELIKGAKDKLTELKADTSKLTYTMRRINDADLAAFAAAFPDAKKVRIHHSATLTNVAPLAKLVHLDDLWLDAKKSLTDLSPLAKLVNLRSLHVFYNASKQDLSWLAPLTKLQSMNLSGEAITSVDTFPTLPKLTTLHLTFKEVPNVDAIVKGAPALMFFGPAMGKIANIDSVGSMPNLSNFRPFFVDVKDFSALAKAPKLEKLEMVGVKNVDYATLGNVKQLKSLTIDRAPTLSSIDWIKGLSNLTLLSIFEASLTDYAPIGSLSKLSSLALSRSKTPVDMSFAKSLTNLKSLRLWNVKSGVTNLAGVSNLPNLDGVYINGTTPALDLAPLTTLPKLKTLYLSKKAYKDVKLPKFNEKVKITFN